MSGEWTGQSLPPGAAARIADARSSGTWSSALSTGEFAAIRSVGFEPVGQVMGSAVYRVARQNSYYGYYDCGRALGYSAFVGGGFVALSGDGAASRSLVQVLMEARLKALSRMYAECTALGGDGVVAASLTMAPFPSAPHCLEFKVIGTAIRARGDARPRKPFSSHMDGEGFAKLVGSGWIPVELVIGMSIGVRHDDYMLRRQNSWAAGNQEITGWTDLVGFTRRDARHQLAVHAGRSGGEGVVLGSSDLRVWEEKCIRTSSNSDQEAQDHVAEALLVGTSVASFGARRPQERTLTVMPLDSRRRRLERRIERDMSSFGTDPLTMRTRLAQLEDLDGRE